MFDLLNDLLNFGGNGSVAKPSGSTIGGYTNLDLSGFVPGGAAQSIGAATTPEGGLGVGSLLKDLWGSAFDSKNAAGVAKQGWLAPVMGVAQGIGNAYMGMKQYGLAEDALKEQKRQFNLNYQNQRKLTNSMLEDRQRARLASNPTAYQSVGDYMKQYGV